MIAEPVDSSALLWGRLITVDNLRADCQSAQPGARPAVSGPDPQGRSQSDAGFPNVATPHAPFPPPNCYRTISTCKFAIHGKHLGRELEVTLQVYVSTR